MFAVAFGTIFSSGISGRMITCLPADKALYFFMAIQAFIIGHLFPQRMTLRTIGYPFQVGMGAGQWPGGQLGMQF